MEAQFRREFVIQELKKNRSQHRAIFQEAVEGYMKEAVRQLEDYISRIKSGDLKKVYVSLPTPEEHTRDYDRVIKMIENSTDEFITLDENDYDSYMLDEWGWKRQFITANSYYSATAASSSQGYGDL